MTHKFDLQELPMSLTHKNDPQKLPRRMTHKFHPHDPPDLVHSGFVKPNQNNKWNILNVAEKDSKTIGHTGHILEFKESVWHVRKGLPTFVTQVNLISKTDEIISDNELEQVIQFAHTFRFLFLVGDFEHNW